MGDHIKCSVTLSKFKDLSWLTIIGNIWNNVSTQLKITNKDVVDFRHFNTEYLHIISLNHILNAEWSIFTVVYQIT